MLYHGTLRIQLVQCSTKSNLSYFFTRLSYINKHDETPNLRQKQLWGLLLVNCLMYNQQLYHMWCTWFTEHMGHFCEQYFLYQILLLNIDTTFNKYFKNSEGTFVIFSVCITKIWRGEILTPPQILDKKNSRISCWSIFSVTVV